MKIRLERRSVKDTKEKMTTFSDPLLIIVGTFVLHQLIFWISNGMILFFTYVVYPDRSKKYKIQKVILYKKKRINSFQYQIIFFRILKSI